MTNSNVLARAITFVAVHALMLAALAVTDGASARERSRTIITGSASTGHTVAAKSGDKHHHHRRRQWFVFMDRTNDDWLIAHGCVVYRIGPDGFPVRFIVRRKPECRAAIPAAAGIHGLATY